MLDVLFLHESMCRGDVIIVELYKIFLGWEFLELDVDRLSGRIITRLYKTMSITNFYCVHSGLIAEAKCKESNMRFRLCNIYGPYDDNKIF
jgi:hypothetical protein